MTFDRLLVSIGRRPLTRGWASRTWASPPTRAPARSWWMKPTAPAWKASTPSATWCPAPCWPTRLGRRHRRRGVHGRAPGEVNYDTIPAVVYTWPEVASVGLTEEQVREKEIPYCVGSFPFSGAGRARCMGETDGFVKLISHGKTDRILGVHIIGPRAADMIAECVLALEFGASSEDISRTIHGHPTFAEALQEAAMNVRKCSIYTPPDIPAFQSSETAPLAQAGVLSGMDRLKSST
jgi:dihydrolipoamide dehydrogenase